MLKVIRKFCRNTSLHGFKFIAARNRMLLERCIWLILIITCALIAARMLYCGYYNLKDDGVRLVLDSTIIPLWDAVFPSVTVCSFNQISRMRAEEASKHINANANVNMKRFDVKLQLRDLLYLTQSLTFESTYWNLTKLQHILDFNDIDASSLFRNISVKCDDMFDICKWKGRNKDCRTLFEPIETNIGFCCSFNYYAHKYKIYPGNPKKPKRLSGIGTMSALQVSLKNNIEDYYSGEISSYGYKIIIHNPYDHPEVGMPTILLGVNETEFITVDPIIRKCDQHTRSMRPKDRNCFFNHERKLYNYRYTFNNCMLECSIKLIVRMCSCIPFYYYNSESNFTNLRICNLRDRSCIEHHRHIIMSSVPGVNQSLNLYNQGYFHLSDCNCLLDCKYIAYDIQSSTGILISSSNENSKNKLLRSRDVSNHSLFRVYFTNLLGKQNTYIVSNSWYAILSLFAGILSLFLGFNFGCIIEIIYYLLLNPLMNCKLQ